jgi:hypothetical protein
MGMLSKRSGADYGKIGLSEKNSAMSARTDKKYIFSRRRKGAKENTSIIIFSLRLRVSARIILVLLTEEKGAFFLCRNHFMGVRFVEAALDE